MPARSALASLLSGTETSYRGDADTVVTGIAYDSRKVQPGDVFGAVPGLSLIHIPEPTRRYASSYAVFCLKKKKT